MISSSRFITQSVVFEGHKIKVYSSEKFLHGHGQQKGGDQRHDEYYADALGSIEVPAEVVAENESVIQPHKCGISSQQRQERCEAEFPGYPRQTPEGEEKDNRQGFGF